MPGIEDLYREVILDHYRNPRNRGELPPPAPRSEGFNPLCGDKVTVTLDIAGETIADVRIQGQGCSISQASASMMTAAVKGKSVDEAHALIHRFKTMMSIHEQSLEDAGEATDPTADARELGDLVALQGVVQYPVRIKCAVLSWNTLDEALASAN